MFREAQQKKTNAVVIGKAGFLVCMGWRNSLSNAYFNFFNFL